MNKMMLAAVFAFTANAAVAGGVVEAVMEEEVVAEATSSSAQGVVVPLLLLLGHVQALSRYRVLLHHQEDQSRAAGLLEGSH